METQLLSIGEVAAQSGFRPSALRYYEDEGLISSAARIGGRRHFDPAVLHRLAVIALCQESGFSVAEMKDFLSEPTSAAARRRWRSLAEQKVTELDQQIEKTKAARRLLEESLRCGCAQVEGCEMVASAGARRAAHRGNGSRRAARLG